MKVQLAAAAVACVLSVSLAAPAAADTYTAAERAEGDSMSAAYCVSLDKGATVGEVLAVIEWSGFSHASANNVIEYTFRTYCPRHLPLLESQGIGD